MPARFCRVVEVYSLHFDQESFVSYLERKVFEVVKQRIFYLSGLEYGEWLDMPHLKKSLNLFIPSLRDSTKSNAFMKAEYSFL